MPIEPLPCGSGAAGDTGPDVEQVLLCDVLPDSSIAGTALAVYEYDETGAPTGPPTFVDPGTGNPYVAQGVLQPCPGEVGCAPPVQFCFTGTSSGPVQHPGRVYDITVPINPGFAVDSLQVDATSYPANLVWAVTDADGSQFASALQAFLAARFPDQTVTVTNPNAGNPVCGQGIPMTVHIECARIDAPAPDLVELIYNGGRDLVVNPGYLTTPPTNLNGPQFVYMQRQDAGGTLNCTSVAGAGWETNDGPPGGADFELWGQGPGGLQTQEAATPTPRGTPIQEITADFPAGGARPTIWQTFTVPAAGTFKAVMVHGARDNGEQHKISLSTGNTDANQIGDIINNVTSPPAVTNSGGGQPGPWTSFSQDVALGAGQYTFAISTTNPVGANRGGLFTDMRVYVDAPGQHAAAVTDDGTCSITTEETTTTTTCEYWQPRCSNGEITEWVNVADGQELTNAAFWGQAPAPSCCLPEAGDGGGGTVSPGNLVHNYEVCGIVNGTATTLQRVVITDQSGGVMGQTFIGPDGGPVTPASWQVGSCDAGTPVVGEFVLCDDNGPFVRKLIQSPKGIVTAVVNVTLTGVPYVPVGTVGQCSPVFAGFVCDIFGGTPMIPATPPTCPGAPLAAPANPFIGSGMTEGPAGTFTPTSNLNAGYAFRGDPNTTEHGVCTVEFVNDPGTGDDTFWQVGGSFIDINGSPDGLTASWITAIEAALGVADASDIPAGSTATAVTTGGTSVTITFNGPSPHSQMYAGNGVFFVREQDGDGLAAGVTLEFDPPVHDFQLITNVGVPTPGSISGLRESQATPGTAAIPAQPAGVFEVKQFRGADGISFYENLDGTAHAVQGTIGECGEYFQELLCDSPTGNQFLRVYKVTGGAISAFQDYTLQGNPYAVAGTAQTCEFNTTERDSEIEVLCWTETATGNITQFLRRYLINRDGTNVDAVIDTLLDGTTGFNASNAGTVAACGATSNCGQSLGTICYTPPVSPPVTLTDNWAGSTVIGANNGPQTITNPNFGGAGITVVSTATKGRGLFAGNSIQLGAVAVGPDSDTYTIDLGAPRTNVIVNIFAFGTNQGELIRNVSPAFTSVTGQGTAVLANTGVNPTVADGTIQLRFAGPIQTFSFDWTDTGSGGSALDNITFTTVGSAQTVGTAAVVQDCTTGEITYIDLATGDALVDGTYTVVDCPTSSGGTSTVRDSEQIVLCDANGTRFVRNFVRDGSGAILATSDVDLAGAAFAPVGAVGVCTTAIASDFDFLSTVLCDANGTQFIQRLTFNSATGAVTSTTNTTLTGAAFAPVAPVALCSSCCPVVVGEGCTNVGSLRYTALRLTNGTISLVDSVTGAAVLPANIVTCAPANGVLPNVAADHFEAVPGTPWTPAAIPAGRRLVSLTYTVLTGTATVVDATGGTSIATIPAGYSATWTAQDDRETLTPPASITSAGGRVLVLMLTAA